MSNDETIGAPDAPALAPVEGDIVVLEPFADFYRREFQAVVGLGFVLTGNRWHAEDLAQLAFTEAHRKWSRIGRYDDPGAWVRRVLVNKSTSRFRKLGSETRALTRLGNRRVEHVAPSAETSEVWAAVRRLPRRQSHAVALLYWEDLPIARIAEVLDCSPETVKTHLKRGRAALAADLEARGWRDV